jgi:AraC-like DNA-binding protein
MSTAKVPVCERLAAWRKAYVETFVPCHIESNSDEPFWSELASMSVGPVIIGSVAGSPKTCQMEKSAGEHCSDGLTIEMIWRGERLCSQGQRSSEASSGEAFVYYNRLPSTEVSRVATEIRTIKIADAAIRRRVGETERFSGVKLSSQIPELRILANYVQSLGFVGDLAEASVREMVGGHVVDLVVAALARIDGKDSPGDLHCVKAARLAAIRRLVEAAFREPTFDTRHAAQRLGISERYIQKLFEETGVTFSDYVTERRLRDARDKRIDQQLHDKKIQEIAWSAGFSDISHFNRLFRHRFGEKPSALRGGRLQPG